MNVNSKTDFQRNFIYNPMNDDVPYYDKHCRRNKYNSISAIIDRHYTVETFTDAIKDIEAINKYCDYIYINVIEHVEKIENIDSFLHYNIICRYKMIDMGRVLFENDLKLINEVLFVDRILESMTLNYSKMLDDIYRLNYALCDFEKFLNKNNIEVDFDIIYNIFKKDFQKNYNQVTHCNTKLYI